MQFLLRMAWEDNGGYAYEFSMVLLNSFILNKAETFVVFLLALVFRMLHAQGGSMTNDVIIRQKMDLKMATTRFRV